MPFQNRVDPFGQLKAVSERGLLTGNRGILHDPATKTLTGRRWTTKSWIICVCEFQGRRRDVMGKNGRNGGAGWTELFFLDEVTALAAGHRPCFYCRRDDAKAYSEAFRAGNGTGRIKAQDIDSLLHRERSLSAKIAPHPVGMRDVAGLPDGAMVSCGNKAYAVRNGNLLQWRFSGYKSVESPPENLALLTPVATINALRAGYRPVWHKSAGKLRA